MNKTSPNSREITKEIRFAVVMYGGISLAIYMNGIAQELMSLVTSTANDAEKKGTASVYKEIAEYLSELTPAFNHKFVIDIISGTSAGGINGICLAKGLVRGLDNLKVLEKIWLDEGNIDTLLNDRESDLDRYPSKAPKSSLFNSQRMYAKLLGAFKDMEKEANTTATPHISSMDLFVTATDLRGIQTTLRLSDGEAYEHIHKHVFPFRYREEASIRTSSLNHFLGEFDPMLAFAARSTSSI
ncbi:MAG: patatin-like phospholipase family protein, partial [Chlorobium sp.]